MTPARSPLSAPTLAPGHYSRCDRFEVRLIIAAAQALPVGRVVPVIIRAPAVPRAGGGDGGERKEGQREEGRGFHGGMVIEEDASDLSGGKFRGALPQSLKKMHSSRQALIWRPAIELAARAPGPCNGGDVSAGIPTAHTRSPPHHAAAAAGAVRALCVARGFQSKGILTKTGGLEARDAVITASRLEEAGGLEAGKFRMDAVVQ